MAQPDPEPEPQRPVEVRLLRPTDLVDLRLEAPGCTLEPTEGAVELVAGPDAYLIVHFPAQHIGEQVFNAGPRPDVPNGAARHVAAGPSRLVYELPEGTRIPYTLVGILAALPTLALHVSPDATPPGEPSGREPTAPASEETAIEAPYHLVVSPSAKAAFRHSSTPVGPPDRVELWRTHLTVRAADGTLDDTNAEQRTVRALAQRDDANPLPDFPQALKKEDRQALVEQTNGGRPAAAGTPLLVDRLSLSSLGASFDWRQSWDFGRTVVDYRHQAFMGRDSYVRVAYSGILFPFGHRCFLVEVTEREVKDRARPVAYLWQRRYIVVRQPTRNYAAEDRDNPFAQISISPLVTPDLDQPAEGTAVFRPTRAGVPFPFTLTTVDRGGQTRSWAAPLVFVQVLNEHGQILMPGASDASGQYFPVRRIAGRGQSVAMAAPVEAGDTSVEAAHLIFDGAVDVENVTSRPFLTEARAVVPSMRHLSPQAPEVDLVWADPYLADGLPVRAPGDTVAAGTPNAGELVLALKSAPPAVDFSSGSGRSGGFVSPNLSVSGISRSLGAVGEKGGGALDTGRFDPAAFFAGALPKLFGLFSLLDLLDAAEAGLDEVPRFVSDSISPVAKLVAEAQRLRAELTAAQERLGDEVIGAAHVGTRDAAQRAKDALDATVGATTTHIDELLAAVQGLPGNPEAVSAAAAALAGDLQPLLDAVALAGVPAAVRSALTKPVQVLATLTDLAKDAAGIGRLLSGAAGGQVTARLSWRPKIKAWGLAEAPSVFEPLNPLGLHVDVEVRASAEAPPAVDVLAELAAFNLNLIGNGAGGLMQLKFRRIAFHAGSAGKPEVDVVFGGICFLGPLAFVDGLRELIPVDGFSDPPFVDVAPSGVTAGFDLTLPNVSVGVFSLENISLGADARVPFLGDAMTVGFRFCSKDAPFRLTVMCVGGGGWLGLRASPKGLVLLELGLEAAAALSVDLGVASGSVSVAVGVYLRLEGSKGLLTAYFRIRGEVDVLGLVSASITLELSLTYQFDTGKLIGRASLVVEVEVLFFSASVEITVERRLAGSKGDPTLLDVMPPDADGSNPDWSAYCDAFAPLPT